jgi:hypothetical protein
MVILSTSLYSIFIIPIRILIINILYQSNRRSLKISSLVVETMQKFFHHILPPILTIILGTSHPAGCAVIYSTVNQHELSVGDRVLYTVTMLVPKDAAVVPPDPANSFGSLAVKGWNSRKAELAKADSLSFEYALTTYKAEPCTIPSIPFILEKGDTIDTLSTQSVPLTVIPLCRSDSADIMDLKPQQVTGKRPLLWLWFLLGTMVAAVAVIAVRYYIRKRRKVLPPPPPKPPYEEAVEALAALEAKQYLMKSMIREYVFELSEILKRYLERRFGINAAEFTTEEMLAWLGISPLDKELRNSTEWFFRAADPVKFAKFLPDQDSVKRFGTEARTIIEATKPQPEVAAAAADGTHFPAAAERNTGGGAE